MRDPVCENAGFDLTALVARAEADPRVLGVAHLPVARGDGRVRLLLTTTWDGLDTVQDELPEWAALVLADAESIAATRTRSVRSITPPHAPEEHPLHVALTREGERLELCVCRLSDLAPGVGGEHATPLYDPEGVLAQWVKWSHGRRAEALGEDCREQTARERVLDVDEALRSWTALPRGGRIVHGDGCDAPLVGPLGHELRRRGATLRDDDGYASALRDRLDAALAAVPHRDALRVEGGRDPRERFLAVADAEGFLGDRMLLDAAEAHLRALSGREPTFVTGFALGTFDAVEARYALGEPVGGCQPPLLPGVYVGIAITPRDELAFWAAPCVGEAVGSTACILHSGERDVVARSAGKEALLGALTAAIDVAYDELPSLLRRVRGAHREILAAPEETVQALHLPRSHVLAADAHGARSDGVNRLFCALAFARAASDMDPLVARKLELASGRLLADAPEADPEDCATP